VRLSRMTSLLPPLRPSQSSGGLGPHGTVEGLRNKERPGGFCLGHGRVPLVPFLLAESRLETIQIVVAHGTRERHQARGQAPEGESRITHAAVQTGIRTSPLGKHV
jgi:hypothetical protein